MTHSQESLLEPSLDFTESFLLRRRPDVGATRKLQTKSEVILDSGFSRLEIILFLRIDIGRHNFSCSLEPHPPSLRFASISACGHFHLLHHLLVLPILLRESVASGVESWATERERERESSKGNEPVLRIYIPTN
ncbi:hypothetical protein BT93_H0341 [Corymbia citriodora subsp. variegata]|nr:hypothetical protein BT93_H0341 [Corymbia citriodora subsp. variegata]